MILSNQVPFCVFVLFKEPKRGLGCFNWFVRWKLEVQDSKFLQIRLLVVHVLSIESGCLLSTNFDVPRLQFPKAAC